MAKVTIQDLNANNERVSLPAPLWTGRVQYSVGLYVTAIYRGPRSGRMFAEFYSFWERRDGSGRVEGHTIREIDADEYLHYCRLADVEPVGAEATEV